MNELATVEARELVVPGVGELVNLNEPSEVARALRSLRDFKTQIEEARSVLERALIAASVTAGTKTLHLDGVVARIGPDQTVGWDITVLVELLDAGLPQDRYDELVTTEVTYKVSAAVARQIAGANPAYAKIVERAKVETPRVPRVDVKPA